MAHDGLARAIYPVHTAWDGDLIFGLSVVGENSLKVCKEATLLALGHTAAQVVARAIASGVYSAAPAQTGEKPSWQELYACL